MAQKPKPIIIGAQLQPGRRYRVMHGGTFECLAVNDRGDAMLRSITSGATFIAGDITMYEDGTISWTKTTDVEYRREP